MTTPRTEEQRLKYNAYMRSWNDKNRDKVRARNREYKKLKPSQYKNSQLLHAYGLTLEEYNTLLSSQNNGCAVCGKPETAKHQGGKVRDLAVDHCHTTGKVRGLLCTKCNTALGLLEDSQEIIMKLFHYVER